MVLWKAFKDDTWTWLPFLPLGMQAAITISSEGQGRRPAIRRLLFSLWSSLDRFVLCGWCLRCLTQTIDHYYQINVLHRCVQRATISRQVYLWEPVTFGCSVSAALALLKWYLLYLQGNTLKVLRTLSPAHAQVPIGQHRSCSAFQPPDVAIVRRGASQSLNAMQPLFRKTLKETQAEPILMHLQSCMTAVTDGNHASLH